jgi:hypothetical protein
LPFSTSPSACSSSGFWVKGFSRLMFCFMYIELAWILCSFE